MAKKGNVLFDSATGKIPVDDIDNASIALVKLADGTDGEMVTWDSSGVAAVVPVGTAGQSLQSGGAGVAPTFQATKNSVFLAAGTIATTGSTFNAITAPQTGTLTAVYFNGGDALATSDINYITFKLINQGQNGDGTTSLLHASDDPNTTKTTGGTAVGAADNRILALHGTPANLDVTAGDRILIEFEASGTLANTVTNVMMTLVFSG